MNITGLSSKPKKALGVSGSPMGFRDRRTKLRRVGASDEHFGARDAEVLAALYPSPLSFYDSVPGCDLSLADFEALAVERLKLLRIMEKHSQVGMPTLGFPRIIFSGGHTGTEHNLYFADECGQVLGRMEGEHCRGNEKVRPRRL